MAGSGNPVSDFADFVEGTGPTYVTGPKDIVNEAVKNTYYFGRLMQGDVNSTKILQGGADIRESVVFKTTGASKTYQPGENEDWINPQRLQKVRAYWKFVRTHMSWTEQEILLNDKISFGDDAARFHQYVDIRNEKELLMWTDKWNFMESLLWAEPQATKMEGEGAGLTEPMSIPALINEDTDGLFGSAGRNADGTAWTTKQGLAPGSADLDGKYVPQQLTYDSAAVNNDGNIISMFDEMWQDIYFEQPTMYSEYWESPTLNKQMILTTKVGRKAFQGLLRAGQDHYVVGGQDPSYPDPLYNGIPVARVSELETATLYANAGGDDNVAESAANLAGPRFYWVNGNYLYPCFHTDRLFSKYEVTKHHNIPDTWVCPVATWYNLLAPSLQRQGILSPSTDLYY